MSKNAAAQVWVKDGESADWTEIEEPDEAKTA